MGLIILCKDKLKTIQKAPKPKNVTKAIAFLGLCNFFQILLKTLHVCCTFLWPYWKKKNFTRIYLKNTIMLSIISRKLSTLSLSCLNIILIELSTFSECWDWHSQQTKVFEAILAITMDLYVAFYTHQDH